MTTTMTLEKSTGQIRPIRMRIQNGLSQESPTLEFHLSLKRLSQFQNALLVIANTLLTAVFIPQKILLPGGLAALKSGGRSLKNT